MKNRWIPGLYVTCGNKLHNFGPGSCEGWRENGKGIRCREKYEKKNYKNFSYSQKLTS